MLSVWMSLQVASLVLAAPALDSDELPLLSSDMVAALRANKRGLVEAYTAHRKLRAQSKPCWQ
jgi:hypothetical protein